LVLSTLNVSGILVANEFYGYSSIISDVCIRLLSLTFRHHARSTYVNNLLHCKTLWQGVSLFACFNPYLLLTVSFAGTQHCME
jgi:hypothetical protein